MPEQVYEVMCVRGVRHRRLGTYTLDEGQNPRDVKARCKVCGGPAFLVLWPTKAEVAS